MIQLPPRTPIPSDYGDLTPEARTEVALPLLREILERLAVLKLNNATGA